MCKPTAREIRTRQVNSSVNIASRCRTHRASIPGSGRPTPSDWFWSRFRLPFIGNREHFHQNNSGRSVKVTIHLQSLRGCGCLELYLHSPIRIFPSQWTQQVTPSGCVLHAGGRKLYDSQQSRAVPASSAVPTALYSRRRPSNAASCPRRSQRSKFKLFLCTS